MKVREEKDVTLFDSRLQGVEIRNRVGCLAHCYDENVVAIDQIRPTVLRSVCQEQQDGVCQREPIINFNR